MRRKTKENTYLLFCVPNGPNWRLCKYCRWDKTVANRLKDQERLEPISVGPRISTAKKYIHFGMGKKWTSLGKSTNDHVHSSPPPKTIHQTLESNMLNAFTGETSDACMIYVRDSKLALPHSKLAPVIRFGGLIAKYGFGQRHTLHQCNRCQIHAICDITNRPN